MKTQSLFLFACSCMLALTACGGQSGKKGSDGPMTAEMAPVKTPEMAAVPGGPEMAPVKTPEKAAVPGGPEKAEMAPDKAPEKAAGGIPEEKLPTVESIVFPKPKMNRSIELDRLQAKAVYLKLHGAVAEAARDGKKLELKPLLESVSVLAKGPCAFGMRAALIDPVPLVTGMPAMHEKLAYGFIVHFLKGTSGDCSAENFCAITVAPAAGDKYQIVAEPLPVNLGSGPVTMKSVVPFTSPHWFLFLEGVTVENGGTPYCSASEAAAGGGTSVTKRRAALLALVQGRFRPTFGGYIGEDSDSQADGQRKNEYLTAVSLFEDKADPAKNFYFYSQERKWFFTKFDEEKGARTTVTKEELECKLINAEGALVFLPKDKQALLEAMDARYKRCNIAGQYVQK